MSIIHLHRHTLQLVLILVLCALALGACRSDPTPEPTAVPPTTEPQAEVVRPTATPVAERAEPTSPPPPTETPAPTATPTEEVAETEEEEDAAPVDAPDDGADPEAIETPAPVPTATSAPRVQAPGAIATLPRPQVIATSALHIRDDETVAPPLTIQVSTNRKLEGYQYLVSGLMRNDDTKPYINLGVIATFFRSDGTRYGPVRAEMQCPILAPGDVCPFIVKASDKDLTEVMLHPDGGPTDQRQPAPVELRTGGRYTDGIGYVHITGSVYNPNPFPVQDILINGALLDNGQIVSIGRDLILGPVATGASVPFDVLVRYAPYSETQLYVQALPPD